MPDVDGLFLNFESDVIDYCMQRTFTGAVGSRVWYPFPSYSPIFVKE